MSATLDGPLLSVVAPVHNEEGGVAELHARLRAVLEPLGPHEIVIVDDGSTDGTWVALRAIAEEDGHVRLIRLSRNFGHQAALTAGLDAARGDAVVSMDGDLQDPPELIPRLVAQWHDGYDVVYAVRKERLGESRLRLLAIGAFYKLINRMSRIEIPEQAGDFRLLSRRALDALSSMPERTRFLRGMTSWVGFRQVGVPYTRERRFSGSSKYSLPRLVQLAGDAVTSFSTAPIRMVIGLGFTAVIFCLVYLAYTLYQRLFTDDVPAGWASVIVVVLFLGGVQLVSLGIIGQYVGRVFEEVKQRPLYFVDEVIQGDDGPS